MSVYISVVMPVFNEEKCVLEAIRRIGAFMELKSWEWELLVASDGSTDKTDQLVMSVSETRYGNRVRLLSFPKNRGKGAVVRQGVLEAKGEYILVTDADMSTPIKEADKLLRVLEEGCDIAIGSRAIRKSGCDVQQSFKRRLSGRVFNLFVRAIILKGFSDTQCGFKCFKNKVAHELFDAQKLNGFSFDVEILFLAVRKGFIVKEVPVMWRQGKDSKVKLFRDSYRMLKDLFYLRRLYEARG